jgi:uncharacterized protein (TIGR02172 family)
MYQIKGKIDSTNAPEFEKELMADLPTEIDAAGLEYISSAGLRVLMKLRKAVGDVTVCNVSPEVYEIFDVTGFTSILTVKKALREIDVTGKEKLGQGAFGTVYRLDDERIVKVYRSDLSLSFIEREQRYAKAAFVSGIPSIIAFDVVKVGDSYGVILEAVNSTTLSRAITDEPEKRDEYIMKLVQLAKALHSTELSDSSVVSLKSDLHARLDNDYIKENLKPEEIALLKDIIDSMKDSDAVLHGDLNPGNVMLQNGELVLIDMGGVTRGIPMYDLACTYRGLFFVPKFRPDICRRGFGLEPELATEIGMKFFSMYSGITDPEALEQYIQKIRLAFCFFLITGIATNPDRDRSGKDIIENVLRSIVLPNADAIKDILSN